MVIIAIYDALHDLGSLVWFKKQREKQPLRSVIFSKVVG